MKDVTDGTWEAARYARHKVLMMHRRHRNRRDAKAKRRKDWAEEKAELARRVSASSPIGSVEVSEEWKNKIKTDFNTRTVAVMQADQVQTSEVRVGHDAADGSRYTALMAMRGMDLVAAATFLAEIGDLSRFQSPRELMAYLAKPTESKL
jgi:Transposase IS116/IS110/IS902 family